MFVLNLDIDGRILSVGELLISTPPDAVIVEEKPDGDHNDYRFIDGKYQYDPLPPAPPPPYAPTSEERIAALEDALAASLLGGKANV